MLLPWMVISSYATIYFYIKKFIFSDVYILVNTMFERLYMFLEWKSDPQVRTQLVEGERGSTKMRTAANSERRCHVLCVRTHLNCLISRFGSIFVL